MPIDVFNTTGDDTQLIIDIGGYFVKKMMIIVTLAISCASAYAVTYFLVASWVENGSWMCKYSNGSVINNGAGACPSSIQG